MSADARDALTAELFGGPRDGETVPLRQHVPRELVFPVGAIGDPREAVYRFARQMGHGTVRYEWGGYR